MTPASFTPYIDNKPTISVLNIADWCSLIYGNTFKLVKLFNTAKQISSTWLQIRGCSFHKSDFASHNWHTFRWHKRFPQEWRHRPHECVFKILLCFRCFTFFEHAFQSQKDLKTQQYWFRVDGSNSLKTQTFENDVFSVPMHFDKIQDGQESFLDMHSVRLIAF